MERELQHFPSLAITTKADFLNEDVRIAGLHVGTVDAQDVVGLVAPHGPARDVVSRRRWIPSVLVFLDLPGMRDEKNVNGVDAGEAAYFGKLDADILVLPLPLRYRMFDLVPRIDDQHPDPAPVDKGLRPREDGVNGHHPDQAE